MLPSVFEITVAAAWIIPPRCGPLRARGFGIKPKSQIFFDHSTCFPNETR